MTQLRILQFPDPRLRTKGRKVKNFDEKIQKIIDDMFETHYAADNCAALAATQLDIKNPPSITVIDFSADKDQPLCLVNPEIITREGEMFEEEGCMSVGCAGSAFEKVKRSHKISVRAQDRHGEIIEFEAEGFMAKCIQHEIDHLHGKLFLDRLSNLRRQRILKKLSLQKKKNK